jgi:hypothetical protein
MKECRKMAEDRERINRSPGIKKYKSGSRNSMLRIWTRQKRIPFRNASDLDAMQVKFDNLALSEIDTFNKEISLMVRYLPELLELMAELTGRGGMNHGSSTLCAGFNDKTGRKGPLNP